MELAALIKKFVVLFGLQQMEECVDLVDSAKFVAKFDLLEGYWQVPLTTHAPEISAFVTSFTLYEYTVMSFGLRNAPATFESLMNLMISGVDGYVVYFNDVVFNDTWIDHIQRIGTLFDRLAEANLTVNLNASLPWRW